MAKMIPSQVPPDTPGSERRVFDLLRNDPGAEGWTVLHSLGLRRTAIGPYGEIDFVVLVPRRGIVCLEIKGGEVSCFDGRWQTRNRATGVTAQLKKTPYLQARENMFQLREMLLKEFGAFDPGGSCPTSYAVVFPDVSGLPLPPDAERFEMIDAADLRWPISRAIERNIGETRKKLGAVVKADGANPEVLSKVLQFLRPNFDRVIARSTSIHRTEQHLISLTAEQYDYLDIADVNKRALVEGAAGTGKTVLALEYARREAAQHRKVLLLCYNRVLAKWLERQLSGTRNVTAATFHAFVRHQILASSYRAEFEDGCDQKSQSQMFQDLYPLYGELASLENDAPFDSLIIDEAQDLIRENNMGVLSALVRGGLAGGRWTMFGDFTRQAIYTEDGSGNTKPAIEVLTMHCPSLPVVVPLRLNCRNSRQIGEETALLSGFEALPYRLATAQGLAVDYRYWKTRTEEAQKVSDAISQLLNDGVKARDIVILSPVRLEHLSHSGVELPAGKRIVEVQDDGIVDDNEIAFATVHSFKGMESPVVILTGFSSIDTREQQALLYVGMSRARSHLILILNEKVKKLIPELMKRRLADGWRR